MSRGPHRRHHVEYFLCCPVGCHGNLVFSTCYLVTTRSLLCVITGTWFSIRCSITDVWLCLHYSGFQPSCHYIHQPHCNRPVTVPERSKPCTVFARSEAGIVGSNWCVCSFFCVCVVLCLGRSLATSWSPVQGVLPSVKDQETEKSALCSKSGSKLPNGNTEEGKNAVTAQKMA
jgi:hypothetical protein